MAYLLQDEGDKYTDNPEDSGGPTKFGITMKSYSIFKGVYVGPEDIQNLTLESAGPFYQTRYWDPLLCAQIKKVGIATAVFDSSVLYGVGTAALLAQEALSACGFPLKLDGVIGDKSVIAFNEVDEDSFLKAFVDLIISRADKVISLNPKNSVFRNGWVNRANRLLTLQGATPLMEGVNQKTT